MRQSVSSLSHYRIVLTDHELSVEKSYLFDDCLVSPLLIVLALRNMQTFPLYFSSNLTVFLKFRTSSRQNRLDEKDKEGLYVPTEVRSRVPTD